jgi:uncharacterized protein (DUF2141 family)
MRDSRGAGARRIFILLALMPFATVFPQQRDAPRFTAPANGKPLCTLEIHVTGFRNQKGNAGAAIFASPNGWPEDNSRSLLGGPFPIQGNQATGIFHLPAGRYAIAAIHDENSNAKLDKNIFGIPKEGFGFANNPKVRFRAPSFDAASTEVACPDTKVDISLTYM